MIENDVRDAFLRAEDLVPDASRLVPVINAKALRRRSRRRVLRSAAAALAVLAVIAVPTWGRGMLAGGDRAGTPEAVGASAAGPPAAWNALIAGIDGRAGQSESRRSDTIILVHVPADRHATYLITLTRDLRVNVPGYGTRRLSEAFSVGGFGLLKQTVTGLTGVPIDGGVTVGFDGLVAIIDSVGGVSLCVDQRVTSVHTGRVFDPGCRQFTGTAAVDYLRQRHELRKGVLDRDRHGAEVLSALGRKVTSADMLTDPIALASLIKLVSSSVVIDAGAHNVVDVVSQLRSAFGTVVIVPAPYLLSDDGIELTESAVGLFAAIRSDTVASWSDPSPPSPQPHVPRQPGGQ